MFEAYAAGYAAGFTGEGRCPWYLFPIDWWRWHVGQWIGNQALCAALEHILDHYGED